MSPEKFVLIAHPDKPFLEECLVDMVQKAGFEAKSTQTIGEAIETVQLSRDQIEWLMTFHHTSHGGPKDRDFDATSLIEEASRAQIPAIIVANGVFVDPDADLARRHPEAQSLSIPFDALIIPGEEPVTKNSLQHALDQLGIEYK